MPAVLNLKPEEIDTNEKRSKYTVSVVGCGQKGILYTIAFAEAGYKVICTDVDQSLVKRFAKGKIPFADQEIETKLKSLISKGQINASSELKKVVSQGDIIVITVSAKIDDKKKIDYSEAINTCKQVGAALRQGTIVIYGGIAGFGFTEGIMKETLENTSGLKVGADFGLAYSPIHISDSQISKSISNLELKIAAPEQTSLDSASTILRTITSKIKQLSDVKTAEIVTLFTVAKQDANTALANELAVFCESANIDFFKISELLDFNELAFCPKILEEENKNEAYLLLESAENLNAKIRLPAMARQINEDMVKHAVNLTQGALRSCGKNLRRARVAVLGTANPRAASEVFVEMIEMKGAKVNLYDPLSKKEPMDSRIIKTSLNEAVEGADCIVILTDQEQLKHLNLKKLKAIMKNPSVIVDLIGLFEPQKVETEGFIYRGLGKGTGEK